MADLKKMKIDDVAKEIKKYPEYQNKSLRKIKKEFDNKVGPLRAKLKELRETPSVETNAAIVKKYITEHGLYLVYYRAQDPVISNQAEGIIGLVKIFVGYDDAYQFVQKYGLKVVAAEEEFYKTTIVLVIIHDNNDGETEHAYVPRISFRKYPTFAFTEDGYEMLMEEIDYQKSKGKKVTTDWIHKMY